MILSSHKQINWQTIRRLAVIGVLTLNFSANAVLAQTADPNAAGPNQPQSQNAPTMPPAWQRFEIRQDTQSERAAFLKKRAEALAQHPPRDVPPLRAQAIVPPTSLKP
jgi:hypothetical protein